MKIPLSLLLLTAAVVQAQFPNFEAAQSRPICISPDGSRLFAVNTPDGRVSVFDISNAANPAPVLIREARVGLEPVSVNALTNDEAWVVNEVGDSVSIVSVGQGITTATLAAKDEPGDVVFAGGKAFVSCSRSNAIRVFDTTTRALLATIPIVGLHPRGLAVSNDGLKIYAAVKFSGNKTTLLPATIAPPQPPPTNMALPPPPQVSLIVQNNDVRLPVQPNMPDNDVAEIIVATNTVARYFKGAGTIHFSIAARPGTDELWVTNTEARNLVRFEPVLKGHSVDNRVTRIATTPPAGTITPFDLNPTINYAAFPDTAGQSVALAQPTGIVFEPDGAHFWIAAFGSDRVARINATTGAVVTRVETGPAADPRNKRGPRGLALAGTRLFVLNRISNTITVVSTATNSVIAEVPVGSHDPTPAVIRQGRGFLYDARLSGNGTQSCASCHIDGDRDDLAWDLGDPGGAMSSVTQNVPLIGMQTFNFHPMKGPMTTQTLRGLPGTGPLHWRADRANFNAFNGAFASLLGGTVLSGGDMNAYTSFINTVRYEPNPNQNLDRSLPASFAGGNPITGRNTYLNEQYTTGLTCNSCHTITPGNGPGTNGFIIPAAALGESQDFKIPQLRNVYQKLNYFRSTTTPSLSGFGLIHDGLTPDIVDFLTNPVFGTFQADATRKANLNAFVQCLDTGTAPVVGYARTGTVAAMSADWTTLAAQAAVAGTGDLIVSGFVDGARHTFRFRTGTNDYVSDQPGYGPFTRAQLEAKITAGAQLTILGVPTGEGLRATDRDGDGTLDYAETMPALKITRPAAQPQLEWPVADSALVLEFTDSLTPANWQPVLHPRAIGATNVTVLDPSIVPSRFYRLRRP